MYIHYLYKFRASESRFNTFTGRRPGTASQAPSENCNSVRRESSWPLACLWLAFLMLHVNTSNICTTSAIRLVFTSLTSLYLFIFNFLLLFFRSFYVLAVWFKKKLWIYYFLFYENLEKVKSSIIFHWV